MLIFSEADCLLGLDFFQDDHCDALFSSMQLRFPNSQTVPLIHNCKALWDSFTEQINVNARENTLIPAGHESVILGELPSRSFPVKSKAIFQPSTAFPGKHQFLAFSSLCESEKMIPARFIYPVEDMIVYTGKSLVSFSVVRSAEIAAMNRVIADLLDHPQRHFLDKYAVKEVMKQTSLPWTQRFVHNSCSSFNDFTLCS